MSSTVAFLKAIRLPNLLIIALMQYLLRWCIIKGFAIDLHGFEELGMSELDFFLLVLSTVMIAAAGYIINDYFDLKIDRINKPEKIIIGRTIKRRVAMGAHVLINSVGLLIATYVSWRVGKLGLVTLHILAVLGLWYYSTNLKSKFFWGNFVIALLAAFVPLTVGFFEVPLLNQMAQAKIVEAGIESNFNFNVIAYWIIGYAAFAFILTLARELTKDMADIKGDKIYGCNTIPIKWGIGNSKKVVSFYYLLMVVGLIYVQQTFLSDNLTLIYLVLGLGILLGITLYHTWLGQDREQFLKAGNWNKWLSLVGIFYLVVAHYIIIKMAYGVSGFVPTIRHMLGWADAI